MKQLTYKNKRSTITEKAHTEVYLNNIKIGYYIKDNSEFRTINKNYVFVPFSNNKFIYITAKTKAELKGVLNDSIQN